MSGTGYDPDFVITINGQDVTKYVYEWKLDDNEKKSTLEVIIKNPDQKFAGTFDTGQEVTLIFGYVGNMGEQVSMTIKKYEEAYSVNEPQDFIKVVGFHKLDDLSKSNLGTAGKETVNLGKQ